MAIANASWCVSNTIITPNLHIQIFGKKQTNFTFTKPISSRNLNLSCHCSNSSISSSSSSSDWDWNRWSRHFSDMEQAESFVSLLKFQLEEAIEKEDFQEAAKLKQTIAEAASKDTVADIMSQLKNAVDDERYHDASRLCKLTGSGLVGWWVGCSKDSNDPFGRVVRITPGVGRFVGRSYTPRQLVTASSGTPLFEIFVLKEADQTYTMQVVFLQRAKGSSNSLTLSPPPSKRPLMPRSGTSSITSSLGSNESISAESGDKNINTKDTNNIVDASEEGLKNVINYLKDRIPGTKFRVTNPNSPKEKTDDSESMEQIVHNDDENTSSSENSDDDIHSHNDVSQLGADSDSIEEGKQKQIATKLFIGGILHNKEEAPSKDDYIRSAAEIQEMERDSFILHVPGRIKDTDLVETLISNVEVEGSDTAQSASELMPLEVAKAFLNVDKNPSKASRNFHEMFKHAISKRNGLSGITSFTRITTPKDDIDPFNGLYVGAFGPLGAELVQLRRKFGHWHGESDVPEIECFEYVEAVKLTGDLNVPAGQVTFRAKIGKGNRNSNRGKYPDDLGVVASYKGQGTIADIGFRNPRWVEGELLQLSGKGMWPYIGGADLGFLYVVPEKSFLVLLNRIKLPE